MLSRWENAVIRLSHNLNITKQETDVNFPQLRLKILIAITKNIYSVKQVHPKVSFTYIITSNKALEKKTTLLSGNVFQNSSNSTNK